MVINAVAAMPEGGTLVFGARYDRQDVCVNVTDTGVGMTDETKDTVSSFAIPPKVSTVRDSGSELHKES